MTSFLQLLEGFSLSWRMSRVQLILDRARLRVDWASRTSVRRRIAGRWTSWLPCRRVSKLTEGFSTVGNFHSPCSSPRSVILSCNSGSLVCCSCRIVILSCNCSSFLRMSSLNTHCQCCRSVCYLLCKQS